MRVKHIDENTIRVQIEKRELAQRGVKMLDLLGNKSNIQDFFYSILREVDSDHTFKSEQPVSFQVISNNGGLDLLISKIDPQKNNSLPTFDLNDPDLEFADNDDDNDDETDDQSTPDRLLDWLQALNQEDDDDEDDSLDQRADSPSVLGRHRPENTMVNQAWQHYRDAVLGTSGIAYDTTNATFVFKDLADVIDLAATLQVDDLAANLYLCQGRYYMDLAFVDDEYRVLKPNEVWAIALEFGNVVASEVAKQAKEQGQVLFSANAMAQIRENFLKKK
ncbi:adaptor protein MecA [Lactobacillus corticis]|uniref:Adapter protein MecA n=1 Tax=Lactobacillus corticis TaxID=2201249 RepID=A0A916QIJ3_9LACO|nr:adaptor protein MecA [Lactobacillus corticis]GFZ26217.1 adapter protein MecA [Lactobacillus corticis]